MKNSKFNPLFETIYNRFQNGNGFLAGDVVKFKSDYKDLDCYKKLGENIKQRIEDIIKTGNNIRVGRLHNSQFSNSYGAMGGTDAPAHLADCYEEVAPSFWRNLVTIPVECLETSNPAIDLPPVPANQKDKQRAYQKPLEATKDKPNTGPEIDEQTKVGEKQTHASKGNYDLATKNTKLNNSNNYDDSKPSKVKGMGKAKELKESYENIYSRMITEDVTDAQIQTGEDIGAMGSGANAEQAYASNQPTPAESQPTSTVSTLPTPQELEKMSDDDIYHILKSAANAIAAGSVDSVDQAKKISAAMVKYHGEVKSYSPELSKRVGTILANRKSGSMQ